MAKKVTKEGLNALLDHMDDPIKKEAIVNSVKRDLKFVLNPEKYAQDAISTIKLQLETARGKNRIQKLNTRLLEWEKRLEIFSKTDNIDKKENE